MEPVRDERLRAFRRAWLDCVERGWCDDIDGAEYRRVLGEWEDEGRPDALHGFIRASANRAPVADHQDDGEEE